jgi:hypothetical protein
MGNEKKIAFCITCKNRLGHIQQTLPKNIEDNYLPKDVEFVLLDYNSTDGLAEWVKGLQKYIDSGILNYYHTKTPEYYHRSHSRNMAFRLSNAKIVCNLDADNYLGKGFAESMIKQFAEAKEPIFITTNLGATGAYGRFCARRDDFFAIRGYNESIAGYGAEDTDLFKRLFDIGLKLEMFHDREFYGVIEHSSMESISEERYYRSLEALYLSYDTPFCDSFILLQKDYTYETGRLIDNLRRNYNARRHHSPNALERHLDLFYRTIVEHDIQEGEWTSSENYYHLGNGGSISKLSDTEIMFEERVYYRITDESVIAEFFRLYSTAINLMEIHNAIDNKSPINPVGFGKGKAYKNFDYTNPIILE